MSSNSAISQARRWYAQHPDSFALTLVALVSLGMRLVFSERAPAFIIGDSENYFLPGFQLAHGLGFDLELRRTPLYPILIAASINVVGEDLQGLMLVQHLLGVSTCLLTYVIGLLTLGRLAGLIAALAVSISGTALLGEHSVMAEVLYTPLLLLHLALLMLALKRRSIWLAVISGVSMGLAVLARPVGLAWIPMLPFAILIATRSFGTTMRLSLAMIASICVVLVPWMARNKMIHDSFSIQGSSGQTLVGRTLRHDSGFSFVDPLTAPDVDPGRDRARKIMQDAVGRTTFLTPVRRRISQDLGLSETDANKLMEKIATEALIRQPGYYVQSTLTNFWRLLQGVPERPRDYWATRKDARNREEWEALPDIRHLIGPPTVAQDQEQRAAEGLVSIFQPARWGWILLAGFLLGIVESIRRPGSPGLVLVICTITMLGAAVALVAPLARYRWPVEPIYDIVAAGGIVMILRMIGLGFNRLRPRVGLAPSEQPTRTAAV